VLFIDGDEVCSNFSLASRNLKKVHVLPQQGANVMDILRYDALVLTLDGLAALEARLGEH
jgi:large subunit ribosomal protein L4